MSYAADYYLFTTGAAPKKYFDPLGLKMPLCPVKVIEKKINQNFGFPGFQGAL
jgi:hypothetical protein